MRGAGADYVGGFAAGGIFAGRTLVVELPARCGNDGALDRERDSPHQRRGPLHHQELTLRRRRFSLGASSRSAREVADRRKERPRSVSDGEATETLAARTRSERASSSSRGRSATSRSRFRVRAASVSVASPSLTLRGLFYRLPSTSRALPRTSRERFGRFPVAHAPGFLLSATSRALRERVAIALPRTSRERFGRFPAARAPSISSPVNRRDVSGALRARRRGERPSRSRAPSREVGKTGVLRYTRVDDR